MPRRANNRRNHLPGATPGVQPNHGDTERWRPDTAGGTSDGTLDLPRPTAPVVWKFEDGSTITFVDYGDKQLKSNTQWYLDNYPDAPAPFEHHVITAKLAPYRKLHTV